MTHKVNVTIRKFATVPEIDGQWAPADYKALLDEMEFGDSAGVDDTELRDMCLMCLQDQEPDDAAYVVLKHIIGDHLREGQLRNMANEMQDEKLWEEYVNPAFHSRLFTVGSLLYAAKPNVFPKTDAVRVTLEISEPEDAVRALLLPVTHAAFVARLLAGGMDDRAVLQRLYGEQLKGTSFPNATDIIWIADAKATETGGVVVEVVSSGYWLDALEGADDYQALAHADTEEEDD